MGEKYPGFSLPLFRAFSWPNLARSQLTQEPEGKCIFPRCQSRAKEEQGTDYDKGRPKNSTDCKEGLQIRGEN